MRLNGINKIQSSMKKFIVDKDSMKQFIKLSNRRDIRNSVVSRLNMLLRNGEHFETPLVANKVNGKFRLLDGNHRFEAMEKYFKAFPQRKVEIYLCHYPNLNSEEEKKMYTKWNLGAKQTTNDFVKQYWDEIPITKMLKKPSFPINVSHVWTTTSMEFKLLFQAYIDALQPAWVSSRKSGTAIDFINFAKELTGKDVKTISAMLTDFIDTFGVPHKKNMHYNRTIFYCLVKIWIDNHQKVGLEVLRKGLKKLRGHERIVYYNQYPSSRQIIPNAKIDLLSVMNGHRKKKVFY